MKKVFLVLILLFSLTACKQDVEDNNDNTSGGNNACSLDSDCGDGTSADYLIAKNQITVADALTKFKNKESFVLYMYFDKCPWCKELGPVVSDVVEDEKKLLNITYALNVRPDGERDHDYRYKNDAGEYNNPDFEDLYNYLYDFLDDDKKVYVPALVFVRNGEIVYYHVGTIDGHDAKERTMTEEEIDELEDYIEEYYSIYED